MKILICGDTHGDRTNVGCLIDLAILNECERIVILGDFGYFEHIPQNPSFVNAISLEAIKANIKIHWIKGNHDKHEMLNRLYGSNISEIAPNIIYHPNCSTWDWDGIRFGAMGGAVSIDKESRIIGYTWWEDEEISTSDLYNCEKMGKVDVLLSHDCPLSGNVEEYCDFKQDALSLVHRKKLQYVVEQTKPDILFHGHFHIRYTGSGFYNISERTIMRFPIIGLFHNYDYRKQSYIFDTETFTPTSKIEEL